MAAEGLSPASATDPFGHIDDISVSLRSIWFVTLRSLPPTSSIDIQKFIEPPGTS